MLIANAPSKGSLVQRAEFTSGPRDLIHMYPLCASQTWIENDDDIISDDRRTSEEWRRTLGKNHRNPDNGIENIASKVAHNSKTLATKEPSSIL